MCFSKITYNFHFQKGGPGFIFEGLSSIIIFCVYFTQMNVKEIHPM